MSDDRKSLSLEEFRNIFVENATVRWMTENGMDPTDPETNSVELDLDNPDSQMSMAKENMEWAFDMLMQTMSDITERGYDFDFGDDDEEEEEFDEEQEYREWVQQDYDEETVNSIRAWLDERLGGGRKFAGRPIPELKVPSSAVHKSSSVFLFLETPPGTPKYVGDVREWLAEVDSLGVSDDHEVDGQLYLDFDLDILTSERSECLYCGNDDDRILTLHECTAGDEDV